MDAEYGVSVMIITYITPSWQVTLNDATLDIPVNSAKSATLSTRFERYDVKNKH